jgi:hypothetical protein
MECLGAYYLLLVRDRSQQVSSALHSSWCRAHLVTKSSTVWDANEGYDSECRVVPTQASARGLGGMAEGEWFR